MLVPPLGGPPEYGNPLGPTIEQLRAQGKTWEQIIESATRPGGEDLGF